MHRFSFEIVLHIESGNPEIAKENAILEILFRRRCFWKDEMKSVVFVYGLHVGLLRPEHLRGFDRHLNVS